METIKTGNIENVKVYVRVRPLLESELEANVSRVISVHNDNTVSLKPDDESYSKIFKFHHVFTENSSQQDIYETIASPIVDTVLKGFNGTIFAYGQTGTGKTYTMIGDSLDINKQGIIPNAFHQIFNQISLSSETKSFVVTATYLEIYNEDVRDLLSTNFNQKLVLHEHKIYGTYVKDLSGFTVNSVDDILKLFLRGNKNRMTKSNTLNDLSSRSHAIFTVIVESRDNLENTVTVGKLNLVDLAGSERLSRTKVTGNRLREAGHINLSLSILGNVISSLVDGKSTYIPYRNSKLTRLLQDSLGGNSKTSMIATISPSEEEYRENVCTLRYATRVRHVKNYVSANVRDNSLIEAFERQIEDLKQRLKDITQGQSLQQKKQHNDLIKTNEKRKVVTELAQNEQIKQDLIDKIESIQNKIIVGGENLLDKVERQNSLLEISSAELKSLNQLGQDLEETLNTKSGEKIILEMSYSSLQEENEDVDKKIRDLQTQLKIERDLYENNQHDYQFDMERHFEDNNSISKDISMASLISDSFIPKYFLNLIVSNITWDKKVRDFKLNSIAYAGNNVMKPKTDKNKQKCSNRILQGLLPPYSQYAKKV